MKASPSRPFILGVTKPSQKDAPCQVAKPHQSNGQLKPSSLPSSKPQLFPRPSSASIAGKRAFILTRSSSGRWNPYRASSAVQSRTRPYANRLAATNSFYEKKKKGSFGRKSFRSDQVTRITQQGTEITTGGDLALISGADQTYQAANLQSGEDLTLTSGGIDFEGVKDLHQESHEKSSSNWAWQSAKGE